MREGFEKKEEAIQTRQIALRAESAVCLADVHLE
jgi:hypothetical protein